MADGISFRMALLGAREVAARLDKSVIEVPLAVGAVVAAETILLQSRVKAHASGRPGPNAPTGHYRRSISRQISKGKLSARGEVGTNAPQGRRLEFGFHGVDSLGRHYNTGPFPHFGPAMDETEGPFNEKIAAAVRKATP